jgi:hypothetical protein
LNAISGPTAVVCVELFRFDVFQLDPAARPQALARLLDTTQKSGVMFEAVFKPVFF